MNVAETIGFAAAACTTFAFVPQVLKSWRTKSARDFSWAWMALFTTGVALWLVYGTMVSSTPVVAANAVSLLLLLALVGLKLKLG